MLTEILEIVLLPTFWAPRNRGP